VDAPDRLDPGVAALGADGEHVYRVPSLELPGPDDETETLRSCESVRLFEQRARQHTISFSVDGATAAIIGRVCRRLDGIPFAIELAAARLRSMSLGDIETRLEQRFELLAGGSRIALRRHQTLQALIDWSWDLLAPAEQDMLRHLSVFAGGFDLAAAVAVNTACPVDGVDCCDLLDALVDKSLAQADHAHGSVRYRLLETIRDYAAAHLAVVDTERIGVARAHRDHGARSTHRATSSGTPARLRRE